MLIGMAISKGDRFALTRNWRGHGAAHLKGELDREFQCILPKDTVLVATEDVNPMATGFHCVIEDAPPASAEFVPEETRSHANYTGYSFVFFTGDIGALLSEQPLSA
jgi:hypothetical protein